MRCATSLGRTRSWLRRSWCSPPPGLPTRDAGRCDRPDSCKRPRTLDRVADLAEEAKDLDATLNSVESVLDLDGMRRRLADLEGEASDPELWNDQERAQQVTSKLSHLRADLTRLEGLRRRVDDLAAAIELGDEELVREVVA